MRAVVGNIKTKGVMRFRITLYTCIKFSKKKIVIANILYRYDRRAPTILIVYYNINACYVALLFVV